MPVQKKSVNLLKASRVYWETYQQDSQTVTETLNTEMSETSTKKKKRTLSDIDRNTTQPKQFANTNIR